MSARDGRTVSLISRLTLATALAVIVPPVAVAGADDPVATVDELLDAVAAGDAAAVDALVCEARHQPVHRLFDVRAQLGIPGTGTLEPVLAFDVADRDLELVDDQEELATVRLRARLTVDLDEDRVRDLVRDMLAPSEAVAADEGAAVSEADLEVMVPLVRDVLAAGQDLDTEVVLIRDAESWLVCGGLGERGEQAGDLPAAVSFDGLCGLVSVAQMSALGPLSYDSSTGADTFCTYSLSSYEDYHTVTVSLDEGFVLEDFAAVAGEVRELSVDGKPALAGAGQLAVQVGNDLLRVEVDLGSDPPVGLDALDQARHIAGLFIPIVGSFAEMDTRPEASADVGASAAHEASLRPS